MNPVNLYFIIPVWGEQFTDVFLNASLPSFLSPGNLGSFNNLTHAHKFKIYTTSKDAEVIKKSAVFGKLKELIKTEIHFIDDIIDRLHSGQINHWDAATISHMRGIEDALENQAAYIPIGCDAVFSDGSFANLLKIASTGKRLVVGGSYRAKTETFVPILRKHFFSSSDCSISISSRELVKISLPHIHPESRKLFWNAHSFLSRSPAYLFWNVGGEGVLQRGIHLHPVLINPKEKNILNLPPDGIAIDGYDYMMRVVPDINDVYVVTDSDEFAAVSLMPESADSRTSERNLLEIAAWIKNHSCAHHINFLNQKIRFHCGDLSSKWEKVERESDKAIAAIHACFALFEKEPDALKSVELLQAEREEYDKKIDKLNWELVDCKGRIGNLENRLSLSENYAKNSELEKAKTHNRLGTDLYKAGRFEDAEASFLRAIAFVPNLSDAHINLAILYGEQHNFKNAIKHIQRALQIQPQKMDVWILLSETLTRAGHNNEAIKYLKKAACLTSDNTEVLSSLGNLALKLGETEVTRIVIKHFDAIEPEHPTAQRLRLTLVGE